MPEKSGTEAFIYERPDAVIQTIQKHADVIIQTIQKHPDAVIQTIQKHADVIINITGGETVWIVRSVNRLSRAF